MLIRGTGTSIFCLGALLCACSAGEVPQDRQAAPDAPNIILISIDSLRPDHLGCYGYERDTSPFIDELASEGLVFENGISTSSWTLPAHAALFTGLRDSVHGLYDNGLSLNPGHVTLAETLKQGGYQTAGFFGGPYLHPVFGLGQGFESYVNCMGDQRSDASVVRQEAMRHDALAHSDSTGVNTRLAVKHWAESQRDDQRPYFLFIHLWDVHYDYPVTAEYLRLFDTQYEGPVDGRLMSNDAIQMGMSDRDMQHLMALYDAEIRFTDDILRDLFADLEERAMLENTLVVVTADHGEEFFEHKNKGHNKTLYDEVLRVPLIVHWPGRVSPGMRSKLQVQLIDLMPSLIKAAGVRSLAAVQGRDLGPVFRGEVLPEQDALVELLIDGMSFRGLRSNSRKVIEGSRGGPLFLADLEQHPLEDVWLGASQTADEATQARLREARRDLDAAIERSAQFKGAMDAGELQLGEGLKQRLQALGYLGEDEH